MTAYEELLEFGGERIFDFLKNARLHESQFKYSEFNEVCYKKMYIENNQDSIKTVKELKEEIPELKDTCKGCGSYFMNPRNKSIKGLDVQFGRLLEDVIIDFLKTKYKLNVTHGDNSNKKYPDCMLLSGDKGILAYFEVKYHGAPFISAINKIGRYCYEGSATLDLNKLVKQIEIVESELDRPVFYLGCGGYPNIVSNYFCGATSFDAATPARRVCDGNKDSAALVHTKIHYKKGKPGFSQYFIGGFNVDGSQRKENPDYINLNEVPDDMEMCGCPACQSAESILNIKNIYAKKVNDDKEAFFYSRQLMGLHAVFQHKLLCEKVAEYDDLESFCSKYSNDLNDGILKVYKQL